MARGLRLSIGQYSDKGRKEVNQDFHGALIPEQPALGLKGIAIALADGISTSSVSGVAAETAIKSFLTDYYCTADSWSVKTSARRVIAATNSWLHAQTQRSQHRYDLDKGYVCTLSVMVVKSATAHIFHIGDCRVYRISGRSLEQLTNDHRMTVSPEETYLGRALGMNAEVEIDYRAIPLDCGDTFMLVTDGVYEHISPGFVAGAIERHATDLDRAARMIVAEALNNGSKDNLTLQIVRIDELPDIDAGEAVDQVANLALPPLLDARMVFDGYTILRQIHVSSRSHIYLASDIDSGAVVALKVPSIDLREDANYLKRFMMEEWVARRIDSPHVLKSPRPTRKRGYLYVVMEYVEGQTLAQWMRDHPKPALEAVRVIVEQIAVGLRAFHRLEMLHQDLRPENILIDKTGTIKIIDFGSAKVAGVLEAKPHTDAEDILGTLQYTAPEYFIGEPGSPRSDLFSLGVIAYQMLTGRLPFGAQVARARTKARQRKLVYDSARNHDPAIPVWVDRTLARAVDPDPVKRYEVLSELVYDLRHPRDAYLRSGQAPLLERNPLLFWKAVSFVLACVVAALIAMHWH
jgi:serine/threonine protein phosphatase PrpC